MARGKINYNYCYFYCDRCALRIPSKRADICNGNDVAITIVLITRTILLPPYSSRHKRHSSNHTAELIDARPSLLRIYFTEIPPYFCNVCFRSIKIISATTIFNRYFLLKKICKTTNRLLFTLRFVYSRNTDLARNVERTSRNMSVTSKWRRSTCRHSQPAHRNERLDKEGRGG